MKYVQLSNAQLVDLLEKGDVKAFEAIYRLFWKSCYRTAFFKLNSKVLAEEVTQNIFTSLWERREKSKIKNLEAFLRSATKYQIINLVEVQVLSKKRLINLPQSKVASNTVEDTIYYKELMLSLEKAIQNLPPKTSQIYLLSRYEYLSGKEIAERMKLSEKSVEYHISKALRFLRIELKDHVAY